MDFLGILLSIFFGFVPMFIFAVIIYWMDRYEKEPKLLLIGVFIWGAVVAAGAAFIINSVFGVGVYIFTQSDAITEATTGIISAPIVEEALKGLAVLIVFLLFRKEFDSVMDGIAYAAVTALGFAATENAFYIYSYGWAEGGVSGLLWLVFVRVILVGWQHPFYTAFTGIGLAYNRLSRNMLVKLGAPVIGFSIAMFTHAMHNTMATFLSGLGGLAVSTLVDWSGWIVMFLFILWAVSRERGWLITHLREEVALGVMTVPQYRVACSAWAQTSARTNAIFAGNYQVVSRFYQVCAELAFKKQQRATQGEEGGNSPIIDRLRAELASLSPRVRA
ncbi:MAG TPA: PrsW family intramembrane metalloprotease [Anaerolineales bacterium]|nr:PrsW family intramembrane metalloprotease [Anaerolineales bacterium]